MKEETITKFNSFQFMTEMIFKLCYFALVFMSFNMFFAQHTYLSKISMVVAAFGAFVLLLRVVHIKDYLNRFSWCLIAFILSYALSSFIMRRYGITENIQAMVWMSIQYFVLFASDKNESSEHRDFAVRALSVFFVSYTFIAAVFGIVMLFTDFWHYEILNGVEVIGGFIWNRLWGVYTDPNYGGVLSLISVLLSIFWFKKDSKIILKIFLTINIICEMIYISMTDSRTTLAAMIASSAILVFMLLFRKSASGLGKKSNVYTGVKKVFICIAASVIVIVAVIGITKALTVSVNCVQNYVVTHSSEYLHASKVEREKLKRQAEIGRTDKDINNGDYSNKRFNIWYSAYEIFKTTPAVGTSFRNINKYAEDVLPQTYLADYKHHNDFHSMHNSVIDIMVSQGVIGLIILLVFVVMILKDIFTKFRFLKGNEYKKSVFMLASVVAVGSSMMFYSETFYMNTAGAFIFWTLLGYLISIIDSNCISKKDAEKTISKD